MTEKVITIDPITRLEGHGKISIFLNDEGNVDKAYLQIPELRGFEKFTVGMPAEEMARITPRICGVCPSAHHMASTKALDDLYKVEPPPAAKMIRDFYYNAFMVEDHAIHFYYLGGPDFIVGPDAPKAERNILGVIGVVGMDAAKKVILTRKAIRSLMTKISGKVIHPVFGLPGGISKPLTRELVEEGKKVADQAVEFAQWTLENFNAIVLGNADYVKLITGDIYTHDFYNMGLVNNKNQTDFYDGHLRVTDPKGKEYARFHPRDYLDHISEHVDSYSFIRPNFLKNIGWKGYKDGVDSSIYRVAPLARLNVSESMSTPLAQAEYERMYSTLGDRPVHLTLATHWARLVEILNAAERMKILINDPEILDSNVREIPTKTPTRGVGCVEAPRGTLIHDYHTDENGVITNSNLLVATQHNTAPICMTIEKAAKNLIVGGKVNDGLLNMVEMAFRAFDPCFACATHALPGKSPLQIDILNHDKEILKTIKSWEGGKM
ncbi:MAG: Ni/Fe hydrogenase subunit alpha [Candidatus Heimdallarchaeota archaeon]|nr:Ni/Fe hydrogenase subunit alpha [Candidatus Heimdallarchaeota archaeon]